MSRTDPHQFALVVADLEDAVTFYRDRLEFELEERWQVEDAGLRFAHMRWGDVRFELMEGHLAAPDEAGVEDDAPDDPAHGPGSVRFVSGELAAATTELEAAGLVVLPSSAAEGAPGRLHILRDPAGRRVEVVEPAAVAPDIEPTRED